MVGTSLDRSRVSLAQPAGMADPEPTVTGATKANLSGAPMGRGVAPSCESVDWQEIESSRKTRGFQCAVDGLEYQYADFHILTTDGTDVCAARDTYLPTAENNNQGLFCATDGNTVRAIYDWDNSNRKVRLTWLEGVEQVGSRSGVGCGEAGATEADRCANQLARGVRAFEYMSGVGGPGIDGLDTSNLKI